MATSLSFVQRIALVTPEALTRLRTVFPALARPGTFTKLRLVTAALSMPRASVRSRASNFDLHI